MVEKMLAGIFYGVKEGIKLQHVPIPKIEEDEVLIEIMCCGVCGSDLAIIKGKHPSSPPVILGHELSGKVVEVGKKVSDISAGDHVTIDPIQRCGTCYYCKIGKKALCENIKSIGVDVNGAYTKYIAVKNNMVYKVPKNLPWELVALAEPLACVLNGFKKLGFITGNSVVIFGAGPIGLLWLLLMKKSLATPTIVVEVKESREKFAIKMGADYVLNPNKVNLKNEIMSITNGMGAEIVIDAAGTVETITNSLKILSKNGKLLVFASFPEHLSIQLRPFDIWRYEKQIIGTYITNYAFVPAIKLLQKGIVPINEYVTHKFPLSKLNEALKITASGEGVKTMIIP